jgi:tetratricopeptide (TPR) repeat protein
MSLSRLLHSLFVFALLSVVTAADAFAQGNVRGRVVDEDTGEPVVDVSVQLTFIVPEDVTDFDVPQLPVDSITDLDGRFTFIGISTGPYVALLAKDGYETVSTEIRANSAGLIYITGRGLDETYEFRLPRILTLLEQILGVEALDGLDSMQLQVDLEGADAAFNAEDYRTAITGYTRVLKALPQLNILHMRVGDANRVIGDHEAAIAAYEAALESDPENADAEAEITRTRDQSVQEANFSRDDFYSLGELSLAGGEFSRALMLYERAARKDPTWEKPVFKLGVLAMKMGNMAFAKERFQKVLELAPDSGEAAEAQTMLATLP